MTAPDIMTPHPPPTSTPPLTDATRPVPHSAAPPRTDPATRPLHHPSDPPPSDPPPRAGPRSQPLDPGGGGRCGGFCGRTGGAFRWLRG